MTMAILFKKNSVNNAVPNELRFFNNSNNLKLHSFNNTMVHESNARFLGHDNKVR